MIQKAIDSITKADIESLIGSSETKTLEFKEKLPGNGERDKKEFLADISSFANASGGDIIFGIKEADGEASEIVPIQGKTADEAKLWIEDVLRSGIEPRMQFHVKEITGFDDDDNGFVILIRVPQSFASPHMVIYKKWSRFYCRHSSGKYQLDVEEIKSSFLATDSQADRIRHFLQDRLAKIMADETPWPMSSTRRLVLHVIPLNSFLNHKRLDLDSNNKLSSHFEPIGGGAYNCRYNLDGFCAYGLNSHSNRCESYSQTFFDGTVEAVLSEFLIDPNNTGNPRHIHSNACELNIVKSVQNYMKGYKAIGADAPLIISMSLIGCAGLYLYSGSGQSSTYMDREVAVLPEVQINSLEDDVPHVMKPVFDSLWNAFGFPRCYNYTENGTWTIR
jgi:schlafen family protein